MKFYRRWKRRFRAGLESTQTLFSNCLQSGDPEVIHDLRVTLRRARLLALVGTPVLGKTGATQFRHWALTLANALGRIRDYDATLEWLKMHSPAGQQQSVLRQQRDQVWRLTLPKLRRLPNWQLDQLQKWNCSAARRRKLRKKFFKECSRMRAALLRDAVRFNTLGTAGRHQFRRRLRRLRYLWELGLSRREQQTDRPLKQLVTFQETLGEMQNCSVARAFFSSPNHVKPRSKLARLADLQERRWLKRAKRHLAAFLRASAK